MNDEDGLCVVCENPTSGGKWYGRVKLGEHTVMLCSPACAKRFYSRRLPLLRRRVLAALESAPPLCLMPEMPRRQAYELHHEL